MTDRLQAVEINPSRTPIGTVIWLHGLGADGHDFAPLVPELQLPETLPLRFVFPHAPPIPVSINNQFVMPAWYDILSLSVERHADQAGIELSTKKIARLIEHEKTLGMSTEKIVLAGFSQGAVMALTTGITSPDKLAGIIALSGYLPHEETVLKQASPANRSIPIFLAHGTTDTVVPPALGEHVFRFLEKNQFPVAWHAYAMPHTVCPEEVRDISAFLQQIFTA
ncbi:MAG TPA: alpha/beta hydrolase-fold protein [Gammaproteobacteria bacterium]|nr:alpha/beta hydrolase-fold protein [Gammaproteobacteria bacterium]